MAQHGPSGRNRGKCACEVGWQGCVCVYSRGVVGTRSQGLLVKSSSSGPPCSYLMQM